MKRHIPNIITLCNLVCGSIAVNQAFCGHYTTALYFIVFGAIFDFFDGFAARKLHVSSPLGVELDSLADLITFGFAPSAMFFALLGNLANSYGFLTAINNNTLYFAETDNLSHINVAAFLIVAFSALRLAKFNLDSRQKTSFLGLPTPANALLLSSVAITVDRYYYSIICPEEPAAYLTAIIALMVLIALSSALLVSEVPLFALKFKNFSWKDNSIRYTFLATSAILIIASALTSLENIVVGIGLAIIWYVALSLVSRSKAK